MSITYSSGSKTITVSSETITFDDLYQANITGSWDIIEKPLDNTYIFHAKVYLVTNSTLADINQTVIFDGLIENAVNWYAFFVDASSILQLGLAYNTTYKTGYQGCTIIMMNAQDNAGYSRPNLLNYGQVYLYDTDLITKRTQGSLLRGSGKWVMWGSKFATGNNEVNFEGIDNDNNDIANCLISRQSSWGCRIDFNKVTFLNTGFIELGASRINYRDCIFKGTYALGLLRGDGAVNYCNLIDCDIDNYNVTTFDANIYYKCSNAVTLYNTVKPTLLDISGSYIESASISLYNNSGSLIFTASTDASGTIITQDVMVRNYQAQGLTSSNYVAIEEQNPHTLIVSKSGFEVYTSLFDLESKYRPIITLTPPEYIYNDRILITDNVDFNLSSNTLEFDLSIDTIEHNIYEQDSIQFNIEEE